MKNDLTKLAALIVRDVCELDPATEGKADTVSVSCAELLRIIERHLADAQAQEWSSGPPPEREMIYAYHPDLVEDDFNPSGVVTAWFSDEWRAGIWNGYTDELNIQPIQIAMWRLIDGPTVAQAVQS